MLDITEEQAEDLWQSLKVPRTRMSSTAEIDKKLIDPFLLESRFINAVKNIDLELLNALKSKVGHKQILCECLKKMFVPIANRINGLDYNLTYSNRATPGVAEGIGREIFFCTFRNKIKFPI
jgi:hypothetical protein